MMLIMIIIKSQVEGGWEVFFHEHVTFHVEVTIVGLLCSYPSNSLLFQQVFINLLIFNQNGGGRGQRS